MRDNVLVSGSRDSTLRVWDLDTGACRFVLRGHTDSVRCLVLHESLAISGSYDHTVRVWNYQTGRVRSSERCRR
jgi:F-box and WD-40 domain protein CDC4